MPGLARSTYQEVWNIRAYAEHAGWGSILVVTSSYHTRRTAQILVAVFHDSPIRVTLVPVPDSWYQAERWWLSSRGRRATLSEYAKFVAYYVGYR